MVMPTNGTPSLVPWQRGLLRTIYGSESAYPGRDPYTVMYGGKTIDDFSDHPRKLMPIVNGPNATSRTGLRTSAAGGYQFLRGSWDEARDANNLPDFSPASQDRAAIWHAERTYKARTGRDLGTDIEAAGGDPQKLTQIGRGLSGWWTSLPGGIEPNKATGSFGDRFAKNLSYAGTEEDPSKPALYSPMAFAGPGAGLATSGSKMPDNQFTLLPQFSQTLTQAPDKTSPVPFSEDPISWIKGRNELGYDFPKGLMAAAAALMSVNNPKGAERLAGMIPSDEDEKFSAHMDGSGNVLQVGSKGTLRQWRTPTVSTPTPSEYQKSVERESGKNDVELTKSVLEGADKAGIALSDVNSMETALKHPGLYQGPGGDQVHEFKKFVSSNPLVKSIFGDIVDTSSVGAGDVAQRITAKNILAMRDPKGEFGGMPGAFTEKEWDRLRAANAGLGNSFEGNMLALAGQRIALERKQQIGQWAQEYLQSHPVLDQTGWNRFVSQKAKENPIPDFEQMVRETYSKLPQRQTQQGGGGSPVMSNGARYIGPAQ